MPDPAIPILAAFYRWTQREGLIKVAQF
jgi:hypothetical protein